MSKMTRIKAIERAYVAGRIAGDCPRDAYKKANPGASVHMIKRTPYILEKRPSVIKLMHKHGFDPKEGRITPEIREALDVAKRIRDAGMSRAEKRAILKTIANDPKASKQHRIMAIQTDNLMTGDNKPVRFEGEITLNSIMQALDPSTALPSSNELIELGEDLTLVPASLKQAP